MGFEGGPTSFPSEPELASESMSSVQPEEVASILKELQAREANPEISSEYSLEPEVAQELRDVLEDIQGREDTR